MMRTTIVRWAILPAVLLLGLNAYALDDDHLTVALWHMDAVSGGAVVDDDAVLVERDNDLILSGAVLVSGGYDGGGSALTLDGVSQYGYTDWPMCETVKVDMWIAATDVTPSSSEYLIDCPEMVELYIDGTDNKLTFTVADSNDTAYTLKATLTDTSDFQHIVASYNNHGLMTLETAAETVEKTAGTGEIWINHPENLYLGAKGGASNFFAGMVDEVKVSQVLLRPALTEETFGVWYFDEEIVGEIPPDDANAPRYTPHVIRGHDNDIELFEDCYVDPCQGMDGGSLYFGPYTHEIGTHGQTGLQWPVGDEGKYIDVKFWYRPEVDASRYLLTMFPKALRILPQDNGVLVQCYDSWSQRLDLEIPVPGDAMTWHYCHMRFVPDPTIPGQAVYSVASVASYDEYAWMAYSSGEFRPTVPRLANLAGNDVILGSYERGPYTYKNYSGWLDNLVVTTPGTKSRCGLWGYHDGDVNRDCVVDMTDLAMAIQQWLDCSDQNRLGECSSPDFLWTW